MKKLKDILKESQHLSYKRMNVGEEEEKGMTNEEKREFLKAVSEYKKFGESIYRSGNLAEVYESIKNIVETAHKVTLEETGDWFDKVTVNRHMKSMNESFKVFSNTIKEVNTLQQRLESCYDEMGEVLGKYYEIKEGNEFGAARAKAIANGDSEFEVDGKKFPVKDVDKEDKENAKKFAKESVNEATDKKTLELIHKELGNPRSMPNPIDVYSKVEKIKRKYKLDDTAFGDYLKTYFKKQYNMARRFYMSEESESVNEGKHDAMLDKVADVVKGASNFMNIGIALKKAGIKYDFSTGMMPMYKLDKYPIAILNKKYVDKGDREVGDVAIGLLESDGETFTAVNKKTGNVSTFKSKANRDAAVKSGTHSKKDGKGEPKSDPYGETDEKDFENALESDGFKWDSHDHGSSIFADDNGNEITVGPGKDKPFVVSGYDKDGNEIGVKDFNSKEDALAYTKKLTQKLNSSPDKSYGEAEEKEFEKAVDRFGFKWDTHDAGSSVFADDNGNELTIGPGRKKPFSVIGYKKDGSEIGYAEFLSKKDALEYSKKVAKKLRSEGKTLKLTDILKESHSKDALDTIARRMFGKSYSRLTMDQAARVKARISEVMEEGTSMKLTDIMNESKYTVINPKNGNVMGAGMKDQAAKLSKKMGGEKKGYYVIPMSNAKKARRALEKYNFDLKNQKLHSMLGDLYYESADESMNEGASTEEKRIVMMAVRKIAKYRNVDIKIAAGDVMRAAQELERDIQKGRVKK